jgi:hypothetical protein
MLDRHARRYQRTPIAPRQAPVCGASNARPSRWFRRRPDAILIVWIKDRQQWNLPFRLLK